MLRSTVPAHPDANPSLHSICIGPASAARAASFKRLNRTRAEHRACLHVFAKTRIRLGTSVCRYLPVVRADNIRFAVIRTCNRRQAPNGASKVSHRVLGARSPDIGTSQKNSAVEDFPVSSLGIHLVALCNRGDFGKEMTGNRAIGFRQAWAYMCCPKPLVRGRCGTRPDRSR